MERRLTAILAADVVGYSRLMGEDEVATLAALKALRSGLIDPKSVQYNGRTIKLMGDGALMEFPSVVEAVSFAVDVQMAMRERNRREPENRRIIYRVGINIGDIIAEDDDLYGDGVNVAARLEGLAEPGGVCLSLSARDQVRDRLDLNLEDRGEVEVKNIARRIRVFRVVFDEKAAALATPITMAVKQSRPGPGLVYASAVAAAGLILVAGIAWWQPWAPDFEPVDKARMALALPDKPSIAVLPFEDLGGDGAQAYFADGMADDLITDLSKLSGLFVISRNSTFTYKGRPVKVQQVAEELGVRYVLEGSVRRIGDQVRINAQLIDALSGFHIWAERYDGSTSDIFRLQDQVIGQIVAALSLNLSVRGEVKPNAGRTSIPAAYDAYLQGLAHYRRSSPQNYAKAIRYFKKAIEVDPNYGRAYAALASIYWAAYDLKWDVHLGIEYKALELAEQNLAKALEHPNAGAYGVLAEMRLAQGRNEDALTEIDRAITLEPNHADLLDTKAWVLNMLGRAEEAERTIRQAMRLNPNYGASYLRDLAQSLFFQRRHAEAAEVMERAVDLAPEFEFAYPRLAAIYGHLGRIEEAQAAVAKHNALRSKTIGGELSIQDIANTHGGGWYNLDKAYLSHWLDGLQKAGVPQGVAAKSPDDDFERLVTRTEGRFDVEGAIKIDAAGARILFDSGAVFIDSRGSNSFGRGHIPGAFNLHLLELTRTRLAEIVAPEDDVVFYCGGEDCYLSPQSCAKAVVWGYSKVYYFAGGYPAWTTAGYEVETP